MDTRYDRFLNAGGPGISATGNQLPYSPRWTAYSQGAYALPLRIPGEVRLGADLSYQTSYVSDVLNRPQNVIGSQIYEDAFLSYAAPGGHWSASLSWEGPVSPPRTVFFKVSYML